MKFSHLLPILVAFASCTGNQTESTTTMDSSKDSGSSTNNYIISRIGAPNESPYTLLEGVVGVDKVTLEYYSQATNGRQIWGSVVPYNKVWQISDYVPLRLSSTSDFFVGGKKLDAGSYYLYLIPGADSIWKLIFNSNIIKSKTGEQYDSTKNVAYLDVKPEKSERFCENLTLSFRKNEVNAARPEIAWEHLRIPFDLKFENTDKVFSRISQYFNAKRKNNQPITWDEYMEAAKFSLSSNLKLDDGETWIDSSILLHTNYSNLEVKAKLLAAQNKHQDAIAYLEKSYNLLKSDTAEDKETGLKTIKAEIEGLKNYTNSVNK